MSSRKGKAGREEGGGGGRGEEGGREEEEGAQGSLDAAVAFLTRHSRLLGFIS